MPSITSSPTVPTIWQNRGGSFVRGCQSGERPLSATIVSPVPSRPTTDNSLRYPDPTGTYASFVPSGDTAGSRFLE